MLPRVLLPKCDRRVTKSQRSRYFSILLKKEPSRPVAFAMSSRISPDLFSDNSLTIDIYVSALLNRALYSSSNSPCKKEPVDVLCKTVRGIQEAQVKGDTAEYHIALQDLVSVPSAVALPQIFFRLMQVERDFRFRKGTQSICVCQISKSEFVLYPINFLSKSTNSPIQHNTELLLYL